MTESAGQINLNLIAKAVPRRAGAFLDLGGLWVRADTIATIKEVVSPQTLDTGKAIEPYCQVVLDVPGVRTLGVACTADTLIDAVVEATRHAEFVAGVERAKGMRHQ